MNRCEINRCLTLPSNPSGLLKNKNSLNPHDSVIPVIPYTHCKYRVETFQNSFQKRGLFPLIIIIAAFLNPLLVLQT